MGRNAQCFERRGDARNEEIMLRENQEVTENQFFAMSQRLMRAACGIARNGRYVVVGSDWSRQYFKKKAWAAEYAAAASQVRDAEYDVVRCKDASVLSTWSNGATA